MTPLEHLILSVFPGDGSGEVMGFTVYFDDSGTHNESSTAVSACFVSKIESWKRFELEWKRASQEEQFGVFHMADFAAGKAQFNLWEHERKQRVLIRLCRIIDSCVHSGFAFGVNKRDYDELAPELLQKHHLGRFHYTFVLRSCIGSMGQWRKTYHPTSSLEYVFDQLPKGTGVKGEIMSVMDAAMRKSRSEPNPLFDGYAFQSRAAIVPLQASDILAWTTFQHMQGIANGRKIHWAAELATTQFRSFSARMRMSHFTRDGLAKWISAEVAALVDRLAHEDDK